MKKLNSKQAEEITLAAIYGFEAYKNGLICCPMQDKRLVDLLKGKGFRHTEDGGLPQEPILVEWLRNWHLANLYG